MLIQSKKLYLLKTKEVWFGLIILFFSVIPQLLYNYSNFGSILATGYDTDVNINRYYIHPKYPDPLYSIEYIPEGLEWGARWIFLDFYFLTPFLTPFYFIGIWTLIKRKKWEILTLTLSWFLVFYAAFAVNGAHGFASLHQLIPVLPPLLFLAGFGFISVCEKIEPFRKSIRNKKDKNSGITSQNVKFKINKYKIQPLRLLVIILILSIIFAPMIVYGSIGIQYRNNEHQTRLDAVIWVKDQTDKDDMVILSQRFAGFRYYLDRFTISLMGWETDNFTHPVNLNPFDVYDTTDLSYEITSHDQVYILVEVEEPNTFINSARGSELDRLYGIENAAPLKTFKTKLPDDYGLGSIMESVGSDDPLEPEIWEVYKLNHNDGG
jgi:hypothetical protein